MIIKRVLWEKTFESLGSELSS